MLAISRMLSFMMLLAMTAWLAAAPAYAGPPTSYTPPGGQTPSADLETCTSSSGYTEEQITSRIVYCISSTIYQTLFIIMNDLKDYIFGTMVTCFALSCAFYGMRIIGGEPQVMAKTVGALVRWGVIITFFNYMGAVAYSAFAITDWLVSLVTPSGYSPWEQIDAFLGRLLGFAPGLTLVNGVAGVIFAIALSGSHGFSAFGVGLIALYNMMMFILEIVYTYLAALLVIAFMMIIAPLIIPLAIFNYTERYFTKWVQNIVGAMLLPMFLFGFLNITLTYFDTLIQDSLDAFSKEIKDANGNPDFSKFWRENQPLYSWIAPGDPNNAEELRGLVNSHLPSGSREHKVLPPMGTEINPTARVGMEMNNIITFGTSHDPKQMQKILFSFIAIFVYALMLMGLVRKMPALAAAVAKSFTINVASDMSFRQASAQAMNNVGTGAGVIVGGAAGSGIGKAIGGSRGRSLGAWGGAAVGGSVGGQLGDQLSKQLGLLAGRRT
ncbi:MAG: hypothetical protein EBV03_03285 [Proteobacteria bacterium]|nr:hypothetical protein [Pseudomonadota bacterium]